DRRPRADPREKRLPEDVRDRPGDRRRRPTPACCERKSPTRGVLRRARSPSPADVPGATETPPRRGRARRGSGRPPSCLRAAWPSYRRRLYCEALERCGMAQHHELVARPNRALGLRIELHPVVLALDAHDDDAEPLAKI